MESASVLCCRLMERLEGGHAVRIRVDGDFLKGVYSRGGAQQKREELLLESDSSAASSNGGDHGDGTGSGENAGGPATSTVELVPWEAAGRLLVACPSATKLPLLRCCRSCTAGAAAVMFTGRRRFPCVSFRTLGSFLLVKPVINAAGRHVKMSFSGRAFGKNSTPMGVEHLAVSRRRDDKKKRHPPKTPTRVSRGVAPPYGRLVCYLPHPA